MGIPLVSKFECNKEQNLLLLSFSEAHRIFGFTLAGGINSCANTKGVDGSKDGGYGGGMGGIGEV